MPPPLKGPKCHPCVRNTLLPISQEGHCAMPMRLTLVLALGVILASNSPVRTQTGAPAGGDWPYYSGDNGFTKYAPIGQINKDNVQTLRIAWRRPMIADELRATYPTVRVGNSFRSTPIMVDGVLYASNGVGLVEAIDPTTGRTRWIQELAEGQSIGGSS